MPRASREFQVFVKPAGPACNLNCAYCYYLEKEDLFPEAGAFRMTEDILEEYIVQHIEACPEPLIRFSWHGGEPTILGLDYFRKITDLQRKHQPRGRTILNGMQTNGILLDENWCRFLAEEDFAVGLSLDGPRELHDRYRLTGNKEPTFQRTMRGYELLQKHRVSCDILCVVNAFNVQYPLRVYRFFKEIGASYLTFLPMVARQPGAEGEVTPLTMTAEAWGSFLCDIFDEWVDRDIGKIKIQIFEEAARVAFGQDHSLCLFRPTCGDMPVVEHNGDFFSCDHFVDAEHRLGNIMETPLAELLESAPQKAFGQAKQDTLPEYCRSCEVLAMCHGECPKNRFINTPEGEGGLNYLCAGYRRFFNHCRPFVSAVSAQWRRQALEDQILQPQVTELRKASRTGRNDPCPCGSGLKYKKCCLTR
jgi:uncharacterized protein